MGTGTDFNSRILLVDDRQENLVALEAALHGLPATLTKARSGEEALRCARRDEFAVLLLDVRMPEMDGFETARHIRQNELNKDTPIIFLSAYGDSDIAKGYSLGAVDYIQKPLNAEILRSKVKVFLEIQTRNKQINETQITSLKREREHLTTLSTITTAKTAASFDNQPLREALPDEFNKMVTTYENELYSALDRHAYKQNRETQETSGQAMRAIAQSLGFLSAGPRDVIDLHITGLQRALESATSQKASALNEEARLMLLELMGHLVSYYRSHAPLLRRQTP